MRTLGLLSLVLAAGCTEYEFTDDLQVDVFQQIQRNTVDILLVVDNSCSMYEEQDNLAQSFSAFISAFETAEADYQIAAVTTDMAQEQFSGRMLGGDDEIILSCPSNSDPDSMVRIDQVSYDRDWGMETGAAMALDPSVTSSASNDVSTNWCLATDTFGDGDAGTPGEANPSCAAARPKAPETGGDTAVPDTGSADTGSADTGSTGPGKGGTDTGNKSTDTGTADTGGADTGKGSTDTGKGGADTGATTNYPAGGKVLITEFLADASAVSDTVGEWVEVQNVDDETLDLGGCTLTDGGVNTFTLPDGLQIEPGAILVFGPSSDTSENGGAPVDVEITGFTMQNADILLTPSTEDPEHIFAEMVAVGIDGSGIEMGLEAAYAALSDPLVNTANIGFLREEASLSLIFVSDEEDSSPLPTYEYVRTFMDIKGARERDIFNASALVVTDVDDCGFGNSSGSTEGDRYIDVAGMSAGVIGNICAESFSDIVTDLSLNASRLRDTFYLANEPTADTIEVSVDGVLLDCTEGGFSYQRVWDDDEEIERPAIVFERDWIPAPSSQIAIRYDYGSGETSGFCVETATTEDTGGV